MQPIFEKNLKKKISTINLGWIQFFLNWKNQKTRIIEFIITLAQIYPSDHQFTERELRAWRRMMKDVGCTNITPFSKDKSQLEFWTYASDFNIDREIIQNLYNDGFLKIKISIPSLNNLSQSYEVTPLNEQKFWNSFQKSLEKNKRGLDGKQRILSIIVEEFGPKELHEKLQVSNHLITSAKHFARINDPGCSTIDKPKVTRTRVTEIQDAQFHTFFSDKNNVSMSSYSVDAKTGLPILYLKENKQSLWEKFEATYPDGIKRTSFMGRLANGQYVYRKDLGGLCNTCNDYGYVVFDLLITLIQGSLHEKSLKQFLINEIENLRYHLRRGFENELVMNIDGTTNHVPCLEHCLLHAFGECNELHNERCENCKQLFIVFQHLEQNLSSEHQQILEESKEKFTYFLAHQAWKKYLNSQYKAQLLDLNEDGDYVGFIQGRPLPHIGNWICFSPEDITKLVERPIHKPTPQILSHTQPYENWIIPLPNFEERVKEYLVAFFLAGDANKTERMSATEMVNTLNQLSKEGEIKGEDIPQIKTVESWITRYSMSLRQKAAEERIINNREKSLNQPLREKNIRNCSKKNTENLQKRQKRNNPNE
ncbi:hypothetical protein Glove_23g66 [Diversispora epigaea]|uniref:Uncharacterized protein n=1 Tax=Diversispora epigaea TaxID=1348612 RepID=A0A397JND1_9GLOM|nr:hypothetical protein Glove_23g66 [Diversispora epigaea]